MRQGLIRTTGYLARAMQKENSMINKTSVPMYHIGDSQWEVNKENNSFTIKIALPGFSKEDISIEIEEGGTSWGEMFYPIPYLHLKGENETYSTSSYLSLPEQEFDTSNDSIELSLLNGILTLTLKRGKRKSEKLKVKFV